MTDWNVVLEYLNANLNGLGFEAIPFVSGWYNSFRKEISSSNPQLIEDGDDIIGYLIIQRPDFFEKLLDFYKHRDLPNRNNFVDDFMTETILRVSTSAPVQLKFRNLDAAPFLHSQSIGYVSGAFQHIIPELISDKMQAVSDLVLQHRTGNDFLSKDLFGVSLHPKYGGWFAFRAVLMPQSPSNIIGRPDKPEPLSFLSSKQILRHLVEFNVRPDECKWRDLKPQKEHIPEFRYSPEAFFYFHEKRPIMRRRFLEIWKAKNGTPQPTNDDRLEELEWSDLLDISLD